MSPATSHARPAAGRRPLLTVAVPTFERAPELAACLEGLLPQVAEQPPGTVEVIVCDNASRDGTWALLQGLPPRFGFLRLRRNPRNLGAEGNFRVLESEARGDYLWLLGDDDVPLPGAVARVLDRIARGYDYMVFDCAVHDGPAAPPIRARAYGWRGELPLDGPGAVLDRVGLRVGYISVNVARREYFGNLPEAEHAEYARLGWAFLLDLYVGLQRMGRGVRVGEVLVRNRRRDYHWNFFERFVDGPNRVLAELAGRYGYGRRSVRRFQDDMLWHVVWPRLVFERVTGRLDVATARRVLHRHYRRNPLFWLLCAPLLHLPGTGWAARVGLRVAGGARGRRVLARAREAAG